VRYGTYQESKIPYPKKEFISEYLADVNAGKAIPINVKVTPSYKIGIELDVMVPKTARGRISSITEFPKDYIGDLGRIRIQSRGKGIVEPKTDIFSRLDTSVMNQNVNVALRPAGRTAFKMITESPQALQTIFGGSLAGVKPFSASQITGQFLRPQASIYAGTGLYERTEGGMLPGGFNRNVFAPQTTLGLGKFKERFLTLTAVSQPMDLVEREFLRLNTRTTQSFFQPSGVSQGQISLVAQPSALREFQLTLQKQQLRQRPLPPSKPFEFAPIKPPGRGFFGGFVIPGLGFGEGFGLGRKPGKRKYKRRPSLLAAEMDIYGPVLKREEAGLFLRPLTKRKKRRK